MAEEWTDFAVRRIVIALDATCETLPALEAAAALAARWRAEVRALFVEDVSLFHIAELPFTRQVAVGHAQLPLERASLDAELKAIARRAERALQEMARRRNLGWSFETVRGGQSAAEALAESGDLLILECTTRPFARHLRLRSRWQAVAERSRGRVLLLGPQRAVRPPVAVAYDGSAAAERALAAALQLADDGHKRLRVLRVGPPGDAKATEERIRRRAAEAEVETEFRTLRGLTAEEMRRATMGGACGLLVLPATAREADPAGFGDFLAHPPCALLLVD